MSTPRGIYKDGIIISFEKRSKLLSFESKKRGRNVYGEFDYIKKIIPGTKEEYRMSQVTEEDKVRYKEVWDLYQKGQEIELEGTPIEMLPGIPPHVSDNCRACNIYTVEQLADLSFDKYDVLGYGGETYVKRAKQFLIGHEEIKELIEKLKESEDKVKKLEEENKKLSIELSKLEKVIPTSKKESGGHQRKKVKNDAADNNTKRT